MIKFSLVLLFLTVLSNNCYCQANLAIDTLDEKTVSILSEQHVKNGDSLLRMNDTLGAIVSWQRAFDYEPSCEIIQRFKNVNSTPNSPYFQVRVLLGQNCELNKLLYTTYIVKADEYYAERNYKLAKKFYSWAEKCTTDEKQLKSIRKKITDCDKKLSQ